MNDWKEGQRLIAMGFETFPDKHPHTGELHHPSHVVLCHAKKPYTLWDRRALIIVKVEKVIPVSKDISSDKFRQLTGDELGKLEENSVPLSGVVPVEFLYELRSALAEIRKVLAPKKRKKRVSTESTKRRNKKRSSKV